MAVSQYISRGGQIDWDVTGHHARKVIRMLLQRPLPDKSFWNVNLPHPLTFASKVPHRFCAVDMLPHAYSYRLDDDGYHYVGTIHDRPRDQGKDVAVCFGGSVSISRLTLGP
jgi:5'-nucleotidase